MGKKRGLRLGGVETERKVWRDSTKLGNQRVFGLHGMKMEVKVRRYITKMEKERVLRLGGIETERNEWRNIIKTAKKMVFGLNGMKMGRKHSKELSKMETNSS